MNTNYRLIDIVSLIEKTCNTKAELDNKFKLEYLISNVTEDKLKELGFEYIEKSSYDVCPIYRFNNIIAHFDQNLLHVYEF